MDKFKRLIIAIALILCNIDHIVSSVIKDTANHDGFIVYCPCMGRFGNQAEQLLGSLYFAKSVNRTLVLPPFINYVDRKPNLTNFDAILKVEPIQNYHKVITMSEFMNLWSDTMWPSGSRTFYCYSARDSSGQKCDILNGEPFRTFWSNLGISEDRSVFYGPTMTTSHRLAQDWELKYPKNKIPVLALVGAPSSFPTHEQSISIQQFIHFSDEIEKKTNLFRNNREFGTEAYVALHVRHGRDWLNACELLRQSPMKQLFSSAQCTGYDLNAVEHLTYDTCLASQAEIIEKLRLVTKSTNVSVIYVATDYDDQLLWDGIADAFPHLKVISPTVSQIKSLGYYVSYRDKPSLLDDLYLMSHADHFIGNCISSFSAFASRYRTFRLNLSTHYFGYPSNKKTNHRTELR